MWPAIVRRLGLRLVRRVIRLALVLPAIVPPLAGAQTSNVDTPAFEIVPSGDAAYKSAIAGIRPADKGGLASATVVRLTRDTTVFRFWGDAGPAKQKGNWWTLEVPSGTASDYRKRYGICKSVNPDLSRLAICTARRGTVMAYGPGQSVRGTCADQAETYEANTKDWQVYIDQFDSNVVCGPVGEDVRVGDFNNLAAASNGRVPPAVANLCKMPGEALGEAMKQPGAFLLPTVRVEPRQTFVASGGRLDLLMFTPDAESAFGTDATKRIRYRVVMLDDAKRPIGTVDASDVWAELATQGEKGTDWLHDETAQKKALAHVSVPRLAPKDRTLGMRAPVWGAASSYVIGCSGTDGNQAVFIGHFSARVASPTLSHWLALFFVAFAYVAAVSATWGWRRLRGKKRAAMPARNATTNAMSWWHHLNPVVLTAGSNGRGSATKLQIYFFSLIVAWLVAYIFLTTGRLSALSSNLLLLMGISAIGAAASAGTDTAKNRLSLDNYAWLIQRGWLPEGGFSDVNKASWKDIITSQGEFDVYRFQMVVFSVIVGASLVSAGITSSDLSNWVLPDSLMGILGLSQAVYVVGKLVAPPSVNELNTQLTKLQDLERGLRSMDASFVGSGGQLVVMFAAAPATFRNQYEAYLLEWQRTRTMFGATLGLDLADRAGASSAPLVLDPSAGVIELPPAKVGQEYFMRLRSLGNAGAVTWSIAGGTTLPPGLGLNAAGTAIVGAPAGPAGVTRFDLSADDAGPPAVARAAWCSITVA